MVKIWYTLIAGGASTLIEANVGANTSKYVRSSRKILRRIVKQTLRRPDGMATLLSGSFAYNYMHGCDPADNETDPDLDNLIFLCVTEALPFSSTPSQTREAAYNFLTQIRRDFIENFSNDIGTLCGKHLSDTLSIDSKMSSNLRNTLDDKTKQDLRRFAAQVKDRMFHEQQKEEKNRSGEELADGRYNISDTNDANPLNSDNMYNNGNGVPSIVIHNGNNTNNMRNNGNNFESYQTSGGNSNNINNNSNYNSNSRNRTSISYDEKTDDLRSRPPPAGHAIYKPEMGGKFDQIKGHISEIHKQVNESIDGLMDRNEGIGLLNDKSRDLQDNSLQFRNRSHSLQRQYCRDLYKQRCIIAFVAIFVLYLLSAMICGWNWDSCAN